MSDHRKSKALFVVGLMLGASSAGSVLASAVPQVPEAEVSVARLLPPPVEVSLNRASPTNKKGAGCLSKVPRSRRDRPDTIEGRQVHVIYLLPVDATDERLDARGILDCSMKAQNDWFEEASGGLRWRLDIFMHKTRNSKGKVVLQELVDVTVVRSARPSDQLDGAFEVAADLGAMGFNDPNKRYLSYVAAEAPACGDAVFPLVVQPGEQPDGQYAQVYLGSDEACHATDFGAPGRASFSEAIAQQELIHNDAIVQFGAPHGCLAGTPPGMGHVCTGPAVFTEGGLNLDPERVDALYPFISVPLSEKVLDLGNDDYFGHPFPHLVDLAESPYVERAT